MKYPFLIRFNRKSEAENLNIVRVKDLTMNIDSPGIYIHTSVDYIDLSGNAQNTLIFGDIINLSGAGKWNGNEKDIASYFKNIKGTFYIIRINHDEHSIEVASSIFGIFPVFYAEKDEGFFASSDLQLLVHVAAITPHISKRFILETVLFNYPLFDRTIYEEVRNLPANSKLQFKNRKLQVQKYLDITALFQESPIPYRKHINHLSDFLIDTVREYFPGEHFNITFTGGFDGRTLVSCAKYHKADFSTFSLGSIKNDDVYLPLEHAAVLGITHHPVYLDEPGYIGSFLDHARDLLEQSAALTNISYTHFLYAAKRVAQHSDYLLTGFGGSEIFRSLDIRGAVTSHELVDFFEFSRDKKWVEKIRNSPKLQLLDPLLVKEETGPLIDELSTYQDRTSGDMSLNERIYIYLYEEIFRKVYGPVITSMSDKMIVRNPFFDYAFNAELLKYSIAGLYSKFFVKNPAKRYKGQVLYGHVIKKTSPLLAGLVTGKGYRPVDLTTYGGLANITLNFVRKRLARKIKQTNLDNLSLISSFEKNKALFIEQVKRSGYFREREIHDILSSGSYVHNLKERDLLLIAFSITLYLDMHHA